MTCCPQHTIRVNALDFQLTKPHRSVLRRVHRKLRGGDPTPTAQRPKASPRELSPAGQALADAVREWCHSAVCAAQGAGALPAATVPQSACRVVLARDGRQLECLAPSILRGKCFQGSVGAADITAAIIAHAPALPEGARAATSAAGGSRLAVAVAEDVALTQAAPTTSAPAAAPTGTASPDASAVAAPQAPTPQVLRVETVPAGFEAESFRLYKAYQVAVHGDAEEDLTRQQYERFLVHSPLVQTPWSGPELGSAPFHPLAPEGGLQGEALQRRCEQLRQLLAAAAAKHSLPVSVLETALVALDCNFKALARILPGLAPVLASGADTGDVLRQLLGVDPESTPRLEDALALPRSQPPVPGAAHARAMAGQAAAWREALQTPSNSADVDGPAAQGAAESGAGGTGPGERARVSAPTDVQLQAAGVWEGSAPGHGFGSFHQKYYLGDRLVAVGVVDVLPRCLSSVYVFYDPHMPSWQWGRYTALAELQWVQRMASVVPSLQWYYMGYYIHTCPKMAYKAQYGPAQLLDPVAYDWVWLRDVRARMQAGEASWAFVQGGAPVAAQAASVAGMPLTDAEATALACAVELWLASGKLEDAVRDVVDGSKALTVGQLASPGKGQVRALLAGLAARTGSPLFSRMLLCIR